MVLKQQIERQLINIFKVQGFSFFSFIKKFILFSYDYNFGKGISSPPLNIGIDITNKCNLKCDFCYLKDSVLYKKVDEITLDDIERVLKSTKKMKTGFYISGGEPMIRKDLINIIKLIKSYKRRCGINTNATFITKEKAKELCESNLDYLFISPHYVDITENIKNLTSLGNRPKVFLNYTLSEEQIDTLDNLIDYVKETKVDGLFLQWLTYLTKKDIKADKLFTKKHFPDVESSYLACEPLGNEFSGKLINKLDSFLKKAKKEGIFVSFKPIKHTKENIYKLHSDEFLYINKCRYIWIVGLILADGEVHPCHSYKIKLGNIKNKDFMDIWNCPKMVSFRNLNKMKKSFPQCNRCCKI